MSECLFCGILSGEIGGNVVYQDPSVVAFRDIRPQAPVHVLIVPRKHIATLLDVEAEDRALLADVVAAANEIARREGLAGDGFRLVVNCGQAAGQTVFHIHFHLLGGRPLTWPPG